MSNTPIRPTQYGTQFKPCGNKTLHRFQELPYHVNVTECHITECKYNTKNLNSWIFELGTTLS